MWVGVFFGIAEFLVDYYNGVFAHVRIMEGDAVLGWLWGCGFGSDADVKECVSEMCE